MLVFNIKLRSHKTRINSCITAATTAWFLRNVETWNFSSLQTGHSKKGCMSRPYSNTMLSEAEEET